MSGLLLECCVACGSTADLCVDHVVPRSAGGLNRPENLQLLCRSCNSSKGTLAWDDWLARERGIGLAGGYPIPEGDPGGVVVRGHVIYRDRPRSPSGKRRSTHFPRLPLLVNFPEVAA